MSESKIYLIDPQGKAVEMRSAAYEKELQFQKLLADHHALMDGEQFDPEIPRKWLLIDREVPITNDEGDRWSLDHLFLDQEAIPTLVEVKRKSDTRLRREVIAQMLDYAANASYLWTDDWLRQRFINRCISEKRDWQLELDAYLKDQPIAESEFWSQARANLTQGRIRLVFVADRVPAELRKIVEFLNEQMRDVEVLALELRYYSGGGYSTHVPRVYGHTARALGQKGETRREWDEASFLADMNRRLSGDAGAAAAITDFLANLSKRFQLRWGTGKDRGSFTPLDEEISDRGPISVYSDGELQVKTAWLNDSEKAERWGELIRQNCAAKGLPFDAQAQPATKLKVGDWIKYADQYIAAIVDARDSVQ